MKKVKSILAVILTVICSLCLFAFTSSAADSGKWITAWGTAPAKIGLENFIENFLGLFMEDETELINEGVAVRTVITPTASGTHIRVKFSNYYGDEPLLIDGASIAVSDTSESDSGVADDSVKLLSFSGYPRVTIPAGQEVYSDPVAFDVKAGQNIAVSTYIDKITHARTMGLNGGTTYLKIPGEGDSATELIMSSNFNIIYDIELDKDTQWLYKVLDLFFGSFLGGTLDVPVSSGQIDVVPVITQVDVFNPNDDAYSVVVLGDSTVTNDYPDYLARRIRAEGVTDVGVSAKGLIGNRLTANGLGYGTFVTGESLLKRLQRETIGLDSKNQGNVKYVILKAGAHDIIYPVCTNVTGEKQPTANELIAGYKQVFDFCHKNGIKVIVIGITPWDGYNGTGWGVGNKYEYKDRGDAGKKADWQIALDVNKWLSNTSLHDGYVDYNSFSKSPLNDMALLPEYTTDGLLPTDTLQKKWADELSLALIGVGGKSRVTGVGISSETLTVYRGSSKTLTAKVSPATANQSVTWSSSDTDVATVDSKGKVTAKNKGEAVITVKTADNGYTASCKVTVKVKPETLKITGKETTVYTTKTLKLTAAFTPSDTDYKTVKWTSSNTKVATVSSKGVVTATGKGKATITATSTFDSKIKATYKITVKKKVQVQAVYLNSDEKTVYVGKTYKLVSAMNPENATFPEVTWKTSNKKIAKVDKNGKVTAVKKGTAVITCTSVDNPKVSATCIINVKIKTKDVELPTKKLTLYVGKTHTLKAEVLPSNASNKKVTWSSSDKKVATVSKSGKITAKKPGTATITVKTKSGGYKATCKITVKKYVKLKSFKLNKTSLSIQNGKSYTLKGVFSPSNASVKDLTWKSSDKSIATVSSKGVVKGIKPGKCIITCKSKATGKTVKCTVTVKKVKVKKVLFAEKTYTVKHNGTLQLKALISPTNATNQKLKWESSHPEFVKVNSKGKVTGLKLGKNSMITVTTADGKKTAYCTVKVAEVKVKSVKLNKKSASVYTGGTVTLTAKLSPSKPSNQKITWSSSDTKLATVSDKGVVTAKKAGTVVITCTTDDGGYTAKCTVKITQAVKVTKVILENGKTGDEADVGAVFNLVATVEPENASNKKLIWTSTNPSVATVSSNGKVTTLKEGLTYIQVRSADGGKSASFRLNVVG